MKKKLFAIVTATFLLFSACVSGYTAEPPDISEPATTFIVAEPVVTISDIGSAPIDIWAAISDFSQELFLQALADDDVECENIVISPLSAYYALAMVALGARSTTLDEFAYILGQDPSKLAPELAELASSLMDVDGSTLFTLAGSVWIRDDHTVHSDFNQAMIDYFGAPAFPRSFDSSTVDEINSWISYQTNGLIDEMLEEIEEEAMMFLINTLYLLTKWAEEIYPMTESVRSFTPESGIEQDANFISTGTVALNARVTDTYEAVLLPYDDDRLGFFAVRPTDGTLIRDFATMHYLADIFSGLQWHSDIVVHMPELDKEFDITMNNMLKSMGLNEAFTPSADLFGLVEYMPLLGGLEISSVSQMVRLIVDKEGAEAAAATIVEVANWSLPLPPLVLDFNTPYIYAIYDLKTGIPLFIGIVDYP